MTKDQILAALPNLSQADLKALQTLIGSLLVKGGGSTAPQSLSGPQAWLFEAIQATLNTHVSYSLFAKTSVGLTFVKNAPAALKFFANTFPSYTGRVETTALMRWVLGLTVGNMKDIGIPLFPSTLCQELALLLLNFDKCYPGYVQCGLAELVADKALKAKA